MSRVAILALVVLVAVIGCAGPRWSRETKQAWNEETVAEAKPSNNSPPTASSAGRIPSPQIEQVAMQSPAPAANSTPLKPQDVARAKELMKDGVARYKKGDYDAAELALKQAMTIYPFLAKTNITLGKIFLIRGAASHDTALIDSARLMFEMARAMDGDTREADVLLELFQSVPE